MGTLEDWLVTALIFAVGAAALALNSAVYYRRSGLSDRRYGDRAIERNERLLAQLREANEGWYHVATKQVREYERLWIHLKREREVEFRRPDLLFGEVTRRKENDERPN